MTNRVSTVDIEVLHTTPGKVRASSYCVEVLMNLVEATPPIPPYSATLVNNTVQVVS